MPQDQLSKNIPNNLAIKLTPDAERILKQSNHPWIFSESIRKINKIGEAGDISIIFSGKNNTIIGIGLYDPASPIRIKMLHFGGGIVLNEQFFEKKIAEAFSKRSNLLLTDTNSYRLIFGENDGFPGLIADVYADVLVIKIYSAIWFSYLEMLLPLLITISNCTCAILRLSRTLQSTPVLEFVDGRVLYGKLLSDEVTFREHGIYFSANVLKGHKTGFFLDHRLNRKKVGELANNKRLLDIFSYAGGFSVHALVNGAADVISVDISAHALEIAKQNAALNTYTGKHTTITGDAFEIMQDFISKKVLFDVVVIDPPSFAKSKNEIIIAKRKYAQLASLGAKLVTRGGLLVLASCSSRISADEFYELNKVALEITGQKFILIEKTGHDIDHPVTFKEGAYLKCGYYLSD